MKAFVEMLKLLGVKLVLSTVYHPQTDGTTEWVNQEIEAYLGIYCALHPEEWVAAFSTLEFTHNNWRHAERQKMPLMSLSVAMCEQTKTNKCSWGFMCGDLTEPTVWSCLAVLLCES